MKFEHCIRFSKEQGYTFFWTFMSHRFARLASTFVEFI